MIGDMSYNFTIQQKAFICMYIFMYYIPVLGIDIEHRVFMCTCGMKGVTCRACVHSVRTEMPGLLWFLKNYNHAYEADRFLYLDLICVKLERSKVTGLRAWKR